MYWRLTRRLLSSVVRNGSLLGQPALHSHPHLIEHGQIYPGHTADEFARRRQELGKHLTARSIAVIPSYGVKYGSMNIFYPFQQNNNMLYLIGFNEPDCCLVLERTDDRIQSYLFVKENDPHTLLWEGPRTGVERAASVFGVDKALPIGSLGQFINEHVSDKSDIFHDLDSNSLLPETVRSSLDRKGNSITKLLHDMRVIKREAEVSLMKRACKRSAEAFKETMKWSMQGKVGCENSLAAKMEFECRLRGATGLSYVPVVASGPRSLILHYTRNDMVAEHPDTQLVFMDAGGKFDGYCTDISRAWPISGRFTDSARRLYQAVLRVQQACIELCGAHTLEKVNLQILNQFSAYLMIDELGKLGFKNPDQIVDRLYPHSIGHYLGLDLHDCPQLKGDIVLKPGMVLTIEPGLYIPFDSAFPEEYHGLGVRIEDDIVIEPKGCTVMTEGVPKDVDEIEALSRSH